MKRNLVALLAALGMLVSLLPLGAFAEEDNTSTWSPPDNKVTDNVEKILVVVSGSDGTSTVTDGDETTEQAVTDFLDTLAVTSNFVVYADSYQTGTHIDGNIAVEHLDSNLEAVKTENLDEGHDLYSYIGDTGDGQTIAVVEGAVVIAPDPILTVSKETLITTDEAGEIKQTGAYLDWQTQTAIEKDSGETVDPATIVYNNNSGRTGLVGSDNLIPLGAVVETTEDGETRVTDAGAAVLQDAGIDPLRFEQEIQIDKNLNAIAAAAEILNKAVQEESSVSDSEAVAAVQQYLAQAQADAQDLTGTVITITLDAESLSNGDADYQHILQQLYDTNKSLGATIVLDVDTSAVQDGQKITITQPLNSESYATETKYLVWNYGAYSGEIDIEQQFTGILVAPLAQVVASGVINGRVIADSLTHSMEIHAPQTPASVIVTPDPSEEPPYEPTPEPTPDETPSPTPEETPVTTPEPTPNESPEPSPTPTSTPTATPTPTEEPTPTATPEETPTQTPETPPEETEQPPEPEPESTPEAASQNEEEAQEATPTSEETTTIQEPLTPVSDAAEVPLSEVPRTGDSARLWMLLAAFSAAALAGLYFYENQIKRR